MRAITTKRYIVKPATKLPAYLLEGGVDCTTTHLQMACGVHTTCKCT